MSPSNSGKSTLLHCLAGIVAPDANTVTYDGRDLLVMKDTERSALGRTDSASPSSSDSWSPN